VDTDFKINIRFLYQQQKNDGKWVIKRCLDGCAADETVVDGNFDTFLPIYSHPGDYFVFEADFDPNRIDDNMIGIHVFKTNHTVFLVRGTRPNPHPKTKNLISYLSVVNDSLQVSLVNLEHYLNNADLGAL
jgi:hypothetical protein